MEQNYKYGQTACIYGAYVDVSKILLLPHIKLWIMIETAGPKGSCQHSHFKNYFSKLQRAMKLIDFETTSQEHDSYWLFESQCKGTKVYCFHSVDLEEDQLCVVLKCYLEDVDTLVNGSLAIPCMLALLCPNIKYYITNGNYADYNDGNERYVQYWIYKRTVKCEEYWLMPEQSNIQEMLFFAILREYQFNKKDLIKSVKKYKGMQQMKSMHDINKYLRTTEKHRAEIISKYSSMYPACDEDSDPDDEQDICMECQCTCEATNNP